MTRKLHVQIKVPKPLYDISRQIQTDYAQKGYRRPIWECLLLSQQKNKKDEDRFKWLRV